MRAVLLLVGSFLRAQALRSTLTVLTVLAATAIVLWVVAGYEALLLSRGAEAVAYQRYALFVDPISRAARRQVPPEVVAELRRDERVSAAEPMWAGRVKLRGEATPISAGGSEVLLLGSQAQQPPFVLRAGSWVDAGGSPAGEAIRACLAVAAAGRLGVGVGEQVSVDVDLGGAEKMVTHRLRVIGLVEAPPLPTAGIEVAGREMPRLRDAALYVSMVDAERILGRPARTTLVGVALAEGVDAHGFRYAWGPRLSQRDNPQQFQEDVALEDELDEASAAQNLALQSYGATALSMLLAFLAIFNTLNMGVTERVRIFALLRAVALTRLRLAVLILIEGLSLAGLGYAFGLLAGVALLSVVETSEPLLQRDGASLGWMALGLAALSAFGAALLAAVIPAWRATRVRPLDAIAPRQRGAMAARPIWPLGVLALLLIAVAPVLCFVVPPSFGDSQVPSLLLSYACLGIGCVLLCPGLLLLIDRLLAPALARLLGLQPLLLAQQLASQLWRNVGATSALSLGLGLFVAMQSWGFTMLETFVPGSWAPDALLVLDEPVSQDQSARLAVLPGIAPDGALPFVVEQPRLRQDLTGSAERASIIRQDNIIMLGLDPDRAFGGTVPLLACEWVRGSAAEAIAGLRAGHGCVVPEHFLRETGLAVGDKFEVVPPENPLHPKSYRIAASVRLSGWHWQSKDTGMRPRTHRAAALVFADRASVLADFGLRGDSHLWLRVAPGADRRAIARGARQLLGESRGSEQASGLAATSGTRLVTVEEVRGSLRTTAREFIWAMSVLPLVVLAIASLGLVNLILASVRARRWEMGVLRAIGFTRGTLVRMVFAESMLIGGAACVLSVGGGLIAGWCGTGAAAGMSFFGGMEPELTVPWLAVLGGSLVLLVFTALAASLPAWGLARRATMDLLRQGRGGF